MPVGHYERLKDIILAVNSALGDQNVDMELIYKPIERRVYMISDEKLVIYVEGQL